MAVDCVDAAGDSSDTYEIWDDKIELWNGREVMLREEELMTHFVMKAQSIIQDLNEEKDIPPLSSTHDVVIFSQEEDDDDRPFEFAPCTPPDYRFAPLDPLEFALIQCGFIKKAWEATKRAAKKAAKAIKKALEQIVNVAVNAAQAIADGTKKAADKAVDFVTEHKKEILISVAVIAAVSGAFLLSGAAGTGAVAAGNSSKRKDDKDEDKNTSSPASPPTDPPPLPDIAKDLLKSIAPEFSIDNASKESIEAIKAEAHNAWNTFGQLKTLTEQDLAHLKQVEPQFDPSSKSIETVMNTVLTDTQRQQLARMGVTTQNWAQFIQNGHDKIDQAFTALAAHRAAIPPPPSFASSFIDKVKLGLEIIGRGMSEPELLDPNSPLDLFFKKENGNIPADLSNQNVREFLQNITETIKNDPSSLQSINAASQAQNSMTLKDWLKKIPICELDYPFPFREEVALDGSSQSRYFTIEGKVLEGMMVGCIFGMNTDFESAVRNAQHIQNFCPGKLQIEAVYNHTNGKFMDFAEIFLFNYPGFSPHTAELQVQKWTKFHEANLDRPYAKILEFCYSQGAIHTKNALMQLPKEIQNRMIVIAIAPGEVIPDDLCFKTASYASEKDIVHLGHLISSFLGFWVTSCLRATVIDSIDDVNDLVEKFLKSVKVHNKIILLEPHEGATLIDHELISPTFDPVFDFYIKDYIKHQGEYK